MRRLSLWLVPLAAAVVGAALGWPRETPTDLTFLAVGQGDAILFRTGGRAILVDAGPRAGAFDAGERIVRPRLRQMGVDRLDALILTHPDLDHVGGAAAVLRAYPEAELLVSSAFRHDSAMLAELGYLRRSPGQVRWLPERGSLRIDRWRIDFWCPEVPPEGIANEGSVITRLSDGSASALLTGDAPTEVEGRLPSSFADPVDVLKAGHHGSRTSTGDALVAATRPRYAVVSCGLDNAYGHPHPEVTRRLKSRGVTVLRTDAGRDLRFIVRSGHLVPAP